MTTHDPNQPGSRKAPTNAKPMSAVPTPASNGRGYPAPDRHEGRATLNAQNELHDLLPDLPTVLVRERQADGTTITLRVEVPALKIRTILYLKSIVERHAGEIIALLRSSRPRTEDSATGSDSNAENTDGETVDRLIEYVLATLARLDPAAIYGLLAEVMDRDVAWVAAHDEFRWMKQALGHLLHEEEVLDTFRAAWTVAEPYISDFLQRAAERAQLGANGTDAQPGATGMDVSPAGGDLPAV